MAKPKENDEAPALYVPKGKVETIKSECRDEKLEVYVTGEGDTALIHYYDVFGWQNLGTDGKAECSVPKSNNVFEFCDMVAAKAGIMVIMPNYLRDVPYTRAPKWGDEFTKWWDSIGNLENTMKEFSTTVLPFVKKSFNIKTFSLSGQCWGGKLAFQTAGKLKDDGLQRIISLHGARITEEDCKAIKIPVYYVCCDGDLDKGKVSAVLDKTEFGKQCIYEKSDQAHGFTAAGGKYRDEKYVQANIAPVIAQIAAFVNKKAK